MKTDLVKIDLLNTAWALLALALAILGGRPQERTELARAAQTNSLAPIGQPDGSRALRDARDRLVPLRAYQRIASTTLLADRVLADLCEPERIVAFTRYAAQTPVGHRYGKKATLSARDDLERTLVLAPDLVVVSDLIDPNHVARLRERGVEVFDLGPARGLPSLLRGIRELGWLIGAPARAEAYASSLQERLDRIAAGARGPATMYLSRYGDKLFAAGSETSYHDVIEYAGLRDATGAAGLVGWPELTAEQVLEIDPAILLTRTGMASQLCAHPGLALTRACRGAGQIIELDGALLDDPGPGLLDAAEALHRAYIGAPSTGK